MNIPFKERYYVAFAYSLDLAEIKVDTLLSNQSLEEWISDQGGCLLYSNGYPVHINFEKDSDSTMFVLKHENTPSYY